MLVIYLIFSVLFRARVAESRSDEACTEVREFQLNLEDLKDPSKLTALQDFLRRNFEALKQNGASILTTVRQDDNITTSTHEITNGNAVENVIHETTTETGKGEVENSPTTMHSIRTIILTTAVTQQDNVVISTHEIPEVNTRGNAVEGFSHETTIEAGHRDEKESPTTIQAIDDGVSYVASTENATHVGGNPLTAAQVPCDVSFEEDCYVLLKNESSPMTFYEADKLCKELNFQVANISEATYDGLTDLVRSEIPNNASSLTVWTGMKYAPILSNSVTDTKSGKLFRRWYPGYPRGKETRTAITLEVTPDPDEKNQGMKNFELGWRRMGVLCHRVV